MIGRSSSRRRVALEKFKARNLHRVADQVVVDKGLEVGKRYAPYQLQSMRADHDMNLNVAQCLSLYLFRLTDAMHSAHCLGLNNRIDQRFADENVSR